MEKYLKIATTKQTERYDVNPWSTVDLYTGGLNGAELAAIVIDKNDLKARGQADLIKQKSNLDIPVIEVDDGDSDVCAKIKKVAEEYENESIPSFLRDLVNFADDEPTSFTTPGHHNGQYYERHPAGKVFQKFFGKKMLYADVSDTIPELGDMMTHAGTPLTAEQQAAKAFNADKVYFCTNGTTSSNTICASAVLTPGDLVLFDRNNHKSLYNSALVMNGAKPVYMPTDRNPMGLIGPLVAQDFNEEYIRQQIAKVAPDKAQDKRPFRLAVLQAETYDGVFYNAKWIIDHVGKLCDYILFDCAWGGYEQFVDLMNDLSPLSIKYGPNDPGILVTQSIHKQQAGLAQTSQILKKDSHIKGQGRYIDHKRFNNAYLKYVTTSYSYPIYASLTVNSMIAASKGNRQWWYETLVRGIEFRKQLIRKSRLFKPFLPKKINGINWEDIPTEQLATNQDLWEISPDNNWHGYTKAGDNETIISPLKITVLSPGINPANGQYERIGIPGPVIGNYLQEKRIIPGKADLYSTLFFLTPGETDLNMQTLLDAFLEFEHLYESNALLKDAMPRLYQQYKDRYEVYTLKQLCQEMHEYYASLKTYKIQQELFVKSTFQDYAQLPVEADIAFMRNQGELVDLNEVEGRIALEGALPYPPGVFIVAPGERWQKVDIDYFKLLMGAIERFPGFDPEIQGVYLSTDSNGKLHAQANVLKEDLEKL